MSLNTKTDENKNSDTRPQKLIIFITVFIYLVGFGVVIPMTPVLGQRLGATPLQIGLLMSTYSVMQFLFAPFWGGLSDKIGRRPILTFCLLGEGLAYILFAFARNLEMFFVARALAGFFGASISTASAYISDITPANERSKGMALIGAAFGLGFVVGPALGGGLSIIGQKISSEAFADTTFAALCVAGISLIAFLFALKFLKESLNPEHKNENSENKFVVLMRNLKKPLVNQLMIGFFSATTAMAMMESTLVLLVGERFNWTIKETSFGFAYIGVIIVITQGFLVRRLLPKLGEKNVLMIGLALFTIGMLGISVANNLTAMAITMTLLSIGNGFSNPSFLGSISILSPVKEQGISLGSAHSLSSLGRIIGPAIGGFLFGMASTLPFLVSGTVLLITFVMILIIYSKLPQSGKERTNV